MDAKESGLHTVRTERAKEAGPLAAPPDGRMEADVPLDRNHASANEDELKTIQDDSPGGD
jgi:hypothetical protein